MQKLRWKEIRHIEDVLDLKGRQTVDFVLLPTTIGGFATIVFFADKEVEELMRPLLQVETKAEYAGFDGVRVPQLIGEVIRHLSTFSGGSNG